MSDSPEEIRAEIERTRLNLGQDVDALADKVTPSKIAARQTDKMRAGLSGIRDRVMGVAHDGVSATSGALSDAGSSVSDAAHGVKAKAEGNPLAVGLIALGAGLLVASLFPASQKEQELAATVKDKAQPLVEQASGVAKEVAGDLKQPVQDAVASVTDTAKDAAQNVKAEAGSAAGDVTDRAQEARENVSGS
ncbi:DUF3618 domain-containing protein [Microbacterium sp. 1P10UB]|uniref:DUF3618 domain-containing protein n=1 Tax=unclassified Microbacterium TaxID=2609290 RepID=UPI0039A289B0